MIRYQTDDEGVVSQPEYTLTKPSNGPNDRDHLNLHELADGFEAERVIGTWMTFYSDVRPHSALGGRTPAEAYGEERAA